MHLSRMRSNMCMAFTLAVPLMCLARHWELGNPIAQFSDTTWRFCK
jgi:hypothetical protein